MNTAEKAFIADCFATLLINSSFSVQKLGHREIEKQQDASSRAHCGNLTWWFGMAMLVIGNIVHIIVLPYADITLLAANSPLAILMNLFLSIWLFGERWIWKYDMPAIVMVVSGTLIIVFFCNTKQ